jgi:hypothetical protein
LPIPQATPAKTTQGQYTLNIISAIQLKFNTAQDGEIKQNQMPHKWRQVSCTPKNINAVI